MQLFCILWIVGFFFSLTQPKFQIHENLNFIHTAFLDLFFQLLTFLGDGIFAVVLSITVFFIVGKKEGILLLLTFLISALLAQFFKNFIFQEFMRPLFFIQAGELNVETVTGVKMHLNNSFPSGHTTTIFSICSMLSLLYDSKKIGFLLLLTAILTAYSRIYLSQHFLQDILAGSFLGVFTTITVNHFFSKKIENKVNNSSEK
jgi:membrane-associated phospholipid phosphatase